MRPTDIPEQFFPGTGTDLRLLLLSVFTGFLLFFCHGQREEHYKITALSHLAVNDDLSAHQPDDIIGNRHPQTAAAVFSGDHTAFLFKRTENMSQKLRFDPFSGIPHPDHQPKPFLYPLHLAKCQGDAAARLGKLHRIGQKVDDDLTQPHRIPDNPAGRKPFHMQFKMQIFLRDTLCKHGLQLMCHVNQVKLLLCELYFSILDPRQIEHIIDEMKQKTGQVLCLFQVCKHGSLVSNLHLCQLQESEDPFHRCTDLMRHL